MMALVLAPTSPCSTEDFETVPGERQASREDIWQQHVLEKTQEVRTELYITYVRVPLECHGGNGLTGVYKTLLP